MRCRCDACGHDLLVAFSCKSRTVCPSCAGRRMANTAAAIVDRVLPDVPVRQYVLSLPYELRRLAAFKADVLTALGASSSRRSSRATARAPSATGSRMGSAARSTSCSASAAWSTFNVHFHVAVLDGVFSRDPDAGVLFHPAAAPTRDELDAIVRARAEARDGVAAPPWLPGRATARRALERAARADGPRCVRRHRHGARPGGDACRMPKRSTTTTSRRPKSRRSSLAVERDGFNLHAGVRIEAGDDLGREGSRVTAPSTAVSRTAAPTARRARGLSPEVREPRAGQAPRHDGDGVHGQACAPSSLPHATRLSDTRGCSDLAAPGARTSCPSRASAGPRAMALAGGPSDDETGRASCAAEERRNLHAAARAAEGGLPVPRARPNGGLVPAAGDAARARRARP